MQQQQPKPNVSQPSWWKRKLWILPVWGWLIAGFLLLGAIGSANKPPASTTSTIAQPTATVIVAVATQPRPAISTLLPTPTNTPIVALAPSPTQLVAVLPTRPPIVSNGQPVGGWSSPVGKVTCDSFKSQADAQHYWLAHNHKPASLDGDKNGLACDSYSY